MQVVYWGYLHDQFMWRVEEESRIELRERFNYSAGPETELAKCGRSLGLELHVGAILNGPMTRSLHAATSQDVGYTEKGVTMGKAALCS